MNGLSEHNSCLIEKVDEDCSYTIKCCDEVELGLLKSNNLREEWFWHLKL